MTPLNSRDLTTAIQIDLATKLVPFVKGSPGIGKTAMMRQIAKDNDLELITVHGSMLEPTDINGFPDVGGEFARFKTFEMFPTKKMKKPSNSNGWLLFLDEINSSSVETQAAMYSLILDKKVGQEPLHGDVYIAAAGNLKTDNAIVNTQSSAMTSRMVNYQLQFDPEIFLEDVVAAQSWEYRAAAYMEWKQEHIHVFDPNKAEDPYACPRTWDMVQQRMTTQVAFTWEDGRGNAQVGYNYEAGHNRASCEGLLGTEIGRDFTTFLRTFGQIPTTDAVIHNPTGLAVPESRGLLFALTVQLRKDANHTNLSDIYEYVSRMDPEFRVVFMRGVLADPSKGVSTSHPAVIDARRNLRRRNP